jgi:predicted ester cyclase
MVEFSADQHIGNKRLVHDGFARVAEASPGALRAALADLYAPDAQCAVAHPINELAGLDALEAGLWRPLKAAFPDLGRTDAMVTAGVFNDASMTACLGTYVGVFETDWLGIPATHKPVTLKFGEAHQISDRRIVRSWILIDVLDLMRQAGVWPLPPSLGAEGFWPPPGGGAGLQLDQHDAAGGAASLDLVLSMHRGLLGFDGKSLRSMDHARYWTPNFMWYGPSGIGATRGLAGFEAHHQIPFLRAFPDRKGGQHYIRIAEGPFVVTGGWPSVTATHTGDGFLGMPATGRRVGMRVMDFYRCEGGLIAENWIPIDILHLLHQMGYDALTRMRHLQGAPQRSL